MIKSKRKRKIMIGAGRSLTLAPALTPLPNLNPHLTLTLLDDDEKVLESSFVVPTRLPVPSRRQAQDGPNLEAHALGVTQCGAHLSR
jgi:hypothetical protein